ncbi:MAG: DUF1080 domain-containing protein [Bacteroidales bacterium]
MKRIQTYLALILVPVSILSCQEKNKSAWTDLCNGKNLKGWELVNGSAPFAVENGEIVGKTVMGSPNSFLATTASYGDFILELDFLVDSSLNSGIQIRSVSDQKQMDGRVHGYQVEIDPSARSYTGGIYDEARRGWLCPLAYNKLAREAFRQGEWNHIRIQALGDTIRTWLNDTPAAWLVDSLTRKGFIALQVHDIGKDSSKLGLQVRWKNIRILTDSIPFYAFYGDMGIEQVNMIPNTLSETEKSAGWELLFDGVSTAGWRGAYKTTFPEKGWRVHDFMLTVDSATGGESINGGDIVTLNKYSDFELKLEFRLSPKANSGIKYFVTESENNQGSAIGLEYQLLDDVLHPDAKLGNHEGSRTLASLYDLIAAENKRVNTMGEWNRARILSVGNHVEHWLNGVKVLEYERGSDEFRKLVSGSKYKVWKNFGEAEEGYILLQDHGTEVSFRSIKIREI